MDTFFSTITILTILGGVAGCVFIVLDLIRMWRNGELATVVSEDSIEDGIHTSESASTESDITQDTLRNLEQVSLAIRELQTRSISSEKRLRELEESSKIEQIMSKDTMRLIQVLITKLDFDSAKSKWGGSERIPSYNPEFDVYNVEASKREEYVYGDFPVVPKK